MSENRLNGLAMTNINKKLQFDESEIIIEFARKSTKRMQVSEWSKWLNTETKIIIIIIINYILINIFKTILKFLNYI
jgi:hypothetical protein